MDRTAHAEAPSAGRCVGNAGHVAGMLSYEQKVVKWPWPGGLVGWHCPIHPNIAVLIPSQGTYLGCRFDTWFGCVWEATD